MTTILLLSLSMATLAGNDPSRAAIAWSPSGEWIAFTLASQKSAPDSDPIRLLDAEPATESPKVELKTTSETTRLWLVRASGKETVLLDECVGDMTAPAWRPDGTSIAYGKLTHDDKTGAGRFAIVIRDGPAPDRERTLWSIDLADARAEARRAREATLAWSPDGKTLAAPRLKPDGLVLIRVEDGKVHKQLDAASLPSWSPTGDRLAFQRAGAPPTIELIDSEWGTPKRLVDLFVLQPPAWTRDGDALLVLAPQGAPWRQIDVQRIDCETEQALYMRTLVVAAGFRPIGEEIFGGSLAMGDDRAEWFGVVAQAGQPSRVTRGSPVAPNQPARTSGPIAPSPVWSLSIAPGSKRLALRVGPSGLPALWDPNTELLSPIAPDPATAQAWISAIVDGVRATLEETYARPIVNGKQISRPTVLPLLGEPIIPGDGLARLRKLVKIGRPLCENAELWRDPKIKAINPSLDVARVFFAALDDDPAAALIALDGVESRARTSEDRLRLLALRGQLYLALGEVERARSIADYLRDAADPAIHRKRIESTTHGDSLIADAAGDAIDGRFDQWSSLLLERARDVERRADAVELGSNSDKPPTRVLRVRVDRAHSARAPFRLKSFAPRTEPPIQIRLGR